jgi:hypothetical protein
MADFQLTPPFSTTRTGFQPPPIQLVPQLSLTNRDYAQNMLGWSVMGANQQIYNLLPSLPGPGDEPLRRALAALSQAVTASPSSSSPGVSLPPFLQSLGIDSMDSLYNLAIQTGQSSWPDVPGTKTNIATGGPVSIGKVDPSGAMVPNPANKVIAGFGIPLPAISAGKRYPFSSGLDIHVYLYNDKDAYAADRAYWISGGGVSFEGKTSDGTKLKLLFSAGRDQAGGGAGFIWLGIGPDLVPMPPRY